MLSTKLKIAVAALLVPTAIVAVLIYWGSWRMEYHLERAGLAHAQVRNYLEIALSVSRQFKLLIEVVAFDRTLTEDDFNSAKHRLERLIQELRALTAAEVAVVGDREPEERLELDRIDRLRAIASESLDILALFHTDSHLDRRLETLLARLQALDDQLGEIIEEVTAEEYAEVTAAERRATELRRRLTMAAGGVTVLLLGAVFATGWWLHRRIEGPIERLVEGTERFAAGALDHRIPTRGSDEIALLSTRLNWMAAELERQGQAADRLQSDLQRQVRERTAELERANQALRRLERLRRGMFADISHELRTPLTVIRGEAEVALRRSDRESQRTALRRVADLAKHGSALVEDLVLMAHSESVAAHLDIGRVDLASLIGEVCEDARAMAASKAIELTCSVPDEAVLVHADLRRLRQLFLILVDNAVRYTQSGGRVTMILGIDPGEATVTVADTGIGVPAEELSLVFDRSYRGVAATDIAPRGTGLGLHLAKSIIHAHQGDIRVSSDPHTGTRVMVHIPRLPTVCIDHEHPAG